MCRWPHFIESFVETEIWFVEDEWICYKNAWLVRGGFIRKVHMHFLMNIHIYTSIFFLQIMGINYRWFILCLLHHNKPSIVCLIIVSLSLFLPHSSAAGTETRKCTGPWYWYPKYVGHDSSCWSKAIQFNIWLGRLFPIYCPGDTQQTVLLSSGKCVYCVWPNAIFILLYSCRFPT